MRQSPTHSSTSSNHHPNFYNAASLIRDEDVSAVNQQALAAPNASAQRPIINRIVQRSLSFQTPTAPTVQMPTAPAVQMPTAPVVQNSTPLFWYLPGMTDRWAIEREEYPMKRRKNLYPTVTPKDLGQIALITPAPSPLLNLLSEAAFRDQFSRLNNLDSDKLIVNQNSWGTLCDIVKSRRELVKYSLSSNLEASDDEAVPFVVLSFRENLHALRQKNRELLASGKLDENFADQIEILSGFLADRAQQKRAAKAEKENIEGEINSEPTNAQDGGIDDVLDDLLPLFALDLLKAQDDDLEKRLRQAQELAMYLVLTQKV